MDKNEARDVSDVWTVKKNRVGTSPGSTHTHTHTHNGMVSAIKNNEILPFAATWMDLEGIIKQRKKIGRAHV